MRNLAKVTALQR